MFCNIRCLVVLAAYVLMLLHPSFAQETVSFETELSRFTNLDKLPHFEDHRYIEQQSSYDTTGGNDDGFSGKYSFISKTDDSSLVIFDQRGKGVINRIWTPTPNDDYLDFYLDGSKEPSFSMRFSDLFSGNIYPFVSPLVGNEVGGYYCYVPIPFRDGCRIVARAKKMQFYQIQFRHVEEETPVESFRLLSQPRDGENRFSKLQAHWNGLVNRIPLEADDCQEVEKMLRPGSEVTLASFDRGGRIAGLEISLGITEDVPLSDSLYIKIVWDGELAAYLPMARFFGYMNGLPSMQSLLLGTKEGVNYCFFPMPFAKKATIKLVNAQRPDGNRAKSFHFRSKTYWQKKKFDKGREGKFFVNWVCDTLAEKGTPHHFLIGKGRGHYIGTLLYAQGLNAGTTEFFEGDDRTDIDHQLRIHGTGSEDYFNGGWYGMLDRWDQAMSLPFHGCLDYSLAFSKTGGYRFFLSDKMPFNEEIAHTIEHGPEYNNALVDYRSVAFYYAENTVEPVSSEDLSIPNTFVPDTVIMYPQLMKLSIEGDVRISKNEFVFHKDSKIRIDLSDLPLGKYRVFTEVLLDPQGADISIWQRQTPINNLISLYSSNKNTKARILLGNVVVNSYVKSLTINAKKQERNTLKLNNVIFIREKY